MRVRHTGDVEQQVGNMPAFGPGEVRDVSEDDARVLLRSHWFEVAEEPEPEPKGRSKASQKAADTSQETTAAGGDAE